MLISSLIKLLRLFLFLLIVFGISRLLFLIYFYSELQPNAPGLTLSTIAHALPLDISAACYLLFVPLLLIAASFFTTSKWISKILFAYTYSLAIIYLILSIGEIGVYREMRIKVYYSAFARIFHPDEIITYLSPASAALMVITLVLAGVICFFLYRGIVGPLSFSKRGSPSKSAIHALLFLLISLPLLVIGCRGGLQPIAINEGEVCFSDNRCVNDAAINAFWNLGHSYIETRKSYKANSYKTMPDDEAKEIVQALYAVPDDTSTALFKMKRPNVCLLILEGWHADLIESLNGYSVLTPHFERLVKEGYLFTQIKSSGHMSDQGIAAILAAYPSLTFGSVINQSEKQLRLPSIGKSLRDENYYTSFLYGGQLIYGGIRKFLALNEFNSITEQKNLAQLEAGSVGIHDSLMLRVWFDSLVTYRAPFFSSLFTLSTHTPYDAPTYHPVDWGDGENQYLNSAAYADRQLGSFFDRVKASAIYDSTIFILVSDHGHHTPRNHSRESAEHYHIPLLFWGGALKEEFRGMKNDRTGSQLDIASTLLHQLGLNSRAFTWSKDLMNPHTRPFAFYCFNDGFGYTEQGHTVIWNRKYPGANKNTAPVADQKELERKGFAMLQVLMEDFLSK